GFSWGSITGNSNGTTSASCGGIAPNLTATFATSSSPSTLASNLGNGATSAIGRCAASLGLSTPSATGSTVTITSTQLGTAGNHITVGATNNTSIYTWSGPTAAIDGTQTCGSSTSGTFISGATPSDVATNLAAAINACSSAFGAVGVTAVANSPSSGQVTVTDKKPGAFLSVGTTLTGFAWGVVSGNSNGSTTCTGSAPSFTGTFITSSTPSTLAANLAAAINTGTCAANLGINTARS